MIRRVRAIDSHTAGEPTRVVIEGGPDLGDGSPGSRVDVFRREHDAFRSAVVNEPRGSDPLVGALLIEATDATCTAGVIFFNNVGFLGMCGHGIIGVIATLAHLGRIGPGTHRIETPVGVVTAFLDEGGEVSVDNVPSWRKKKDLPVEVAGVGPVRGDVAWGGNWFLLVHDHGQEVTLGNVAVLTRYATSVREALNAHGFPEVDHVELIAPSQHPGNHASNFVLCPGGAYDRSPCGTGTSAKLACLAADGNLGEGELWVQEGILGSTFTGQYRWANRSRGEIIPIISGSAHVTAETVLLLDDRDPFCWGIR